MQPVFHLRSRAFWRTLLCAAAGCALMAATRPTAAAAEDARRNYDLPADNAELALKLFSQQSGRGIIVGAEAVKEVRTNAVKGSLTAPEALARMLAGTGLVAVVDDRNGAFAVRRENAGPNGHGAAQLVGSGRPTSPDAPGSAGSSNRSAQGTGTISGRVQNIVTGKYLNNARVTVRGTELVALTDAFGTYRLVNVRSGPIILEAFYTDLDVQQIPLQVVAGGNVEQDIGLTSQARYGQKTDVVTLDPFLVSSERETDAQAIATNEQRFAANIKSVVAVDTIGDVRGEGVGDFLKFLPGLIADYSGDEIVGISARGFDTELTNFSIDGEASVTASSTAARQFRLLSPSLNSVSRIEMTKVPLPSTPADSLGGSVNMISKSAFEQRTAQLRYGINLIGSSDNLALKRTPDTDDQLTWKIQPNADFDYTLPINKNFGLVLSGSHSSRFNPQHLTSLSYNAAGTGTGATISKPFLQTHTLAHGPRNQERNSGSLKVDWRVTPKSVVSAGFQASNYYIIGGFLNWITNTGTTGTPNPATLPNAVSFSSGDTFTIGASGRGAVTMNPTVGIASGKNTVANLNYRYDDGIWRIEAGVSRTQAKSWSPAIPRGQGEGRFTSVAIALRDPVRVSFLEITPDRPGSTKAYNNTNQEVDIYNLANYQLTTATSTDYDNSAGMKTGNVNLRRNFDFLSLPTAVQIGGRQNAQTRDTLRGSATWTYNGTDGNAATPDSPAPYAMQLYKPADSDYGYKNVPYVSTRRMYDAWQKNPILFTETTAQKVAEENFRITNSQYIKETVSALYLQIESRLLGNRLGLTTGVRYEQTSDQASGALVDPNAVYQRDAKGFFLRTATGARIRRPEAGAAGSMEELLLVRKERAAKADRSYAGYYPSLHLTYQVRDNFLVRGAYAKTYGRPKFSDIIPSTTISELDLTESQLNDPNVVPGTITLSNTGLKPWSADNYDLSLEYYTEQGGLFSAGAFIKEIRDFFGDEVRVATAADIDELGLDPRYLGWRISTAFNSGNARVSGVEFNFRHSLQPLGAWGRHFSAFVNGTKLRLEGNRQADFTGFTPESANWGLTFSRNRISVMAKWNYVGLRRRGALPTLGPDAYEYWKAQTRIDVSLGYQLTSRLRLTTSLSNLLNEPQTLLRYGSQTPGYARQFRRGEYGVSIAVGIKGTF